MIPQSDFIVVDEVVQVDEALAGLVVGAAVEVQPFSSASVALLDS